MPLYRSTAENILSKSRPTLLQSPVTSTSTCGFIVGSSTSSKYQVQDCQQHSAVWRQTLASWSKADAT